MKFDWKRMGALMAALALILTSLGNLPLAVSAEEIEGEETAVEVVRTEAYVLNYAPSKLTANYEFNVPYMYCTPFMVEHTITDEDWEEYYSGGNFPEVFNLINTTKLGSGGDGAYASIPAYCTDASTGIEENASYRRINLEDSTYYITGAAGKIRAVVLNGFPQQSVEDIQTDANAWLRSKELPEIVELQSGEAILATQVAIWKLANDAHYTIDQYYYGWKNLTTDGWKGYRESAVDSSAANQKETSHTAQNIESLFQYLYQLEAEMPRYDAVSEESFEDTHYSAVKEADGTYTVTVSAMVNTTVGEGDSLTVSASCGGQIQGQHVTEAGEYSFIFNGLAERESAVLELNGYQCGGDVYLFDAEGGRGESQTLVGYDDSRLPVHGEITLTPDRILNIFKSTSEESSKLPLADISFDIYRVATMEQVEKGEVSLSAQPMETEIEKYQTEENHVVTLTTDAMGNASYNFTENGEADGVYMIVEQFSAATTGVVEPFFLMVPGTSEDGGRQVYTLNVNPKNVTETGPEILKDVTRIDNDSDTFDVGESLTWIIRGGIPVGIGNAKQYIITDTIDYRLNYERGSPVVTLCTRAGNEVPLTKGIHYTLEETTVTVDGRNVDRFQIALTGDGMAYVAAQQGSGDGTPEIRVYFSAAINENAVMGANIPNQAHLDYTNSAGVDYDDDSDIPEVHTGGVHVLKTDAENAPLEGAVFRMARKATDAELADGTVEKKLLNVGDEELTVVFVSFYAAEDMSGAKVSEVITGKEGRAVFYGFAYGTYYLVETRAPEGYNLLTQPIEVLIHESSHLTAENQKTDGNGELIDNTIHVVNTRFILPETGGMGTTAFTVVGILIIGAACILLLSNRKKRF